jgi:hypothetical protein
VRFKQTVDIICDTTADLPSPEEIERKGFDTGSFAYIANERTKVMLNCAKEWVEC